MWVEQTVQRTIVLQELPLDLVPLRCRPTIAHADQPCPQFLIGHTRIALQVSDSNSIVRSESQ
jgi:hypothetical protein